MAAAEAMTRSQDRSSSRMRPFAWMKRLAGRKPTKCATDAERNDGLAPSSPKKMRRSNNTPQSSPVHDYKEYSNIPAASSCGQERRGSFDSSAERTNGHNQAESYRSIAPTVATNQGTLLSESGFSKAGTTNTAGGGNSIFSSPNHSNPSITTSLTTIQSQPAGAPLNNAQAHGHPSTYFSHQYPTPPVSALPAHLNRSSHVPTTYRSATANNLLTDNASILTLASSSGRNHRRNSLDTDASIRPIRPSSTWGGSRESLPLSVLSQNIEYVSGAHVLHHSASRGMMKDDRASIYSSNGIGVGAPVLSSERNSIYAGKTSNGAGIDGQSTRAQAADSASVGSGLTGHGRNNSATGSTGGYSTILGGFRDGFGDGDRINEQ